MEVWYAKWKREENMARSKAAVQRKGGSSLDWPKEKKVCSLHICA
jgi:hypothetical protein